jgi:hypothetical protein
MIYKLWKNFYKGFTGYNFQGEDSDLCRSSFYALIPVILSFIILMIVCVK